MSNDIDRFRQRLGDFLSGHTREKSHLDKCDQAGVFSAEPVKSLIQFEHIADRGCLRQTFLKLHLQTVDPFPCCASTSVIHQNPAHHTRRNPEEMRPVCNAGHLATEETQESLVQQRRRLERVVFAVRAKSGPRQPMKFVVHQRDELV